MIKFAAGLLFLGAMSAASVGLASDTVATDPSCYEVNLSYIRSRSHPIYSENLDLISEDGSRRRYLRLEIDGHKARSWRVFDRRWIDVERPYDSVSDRTSPKFTDCVRLNSENGTNGTDGGLIHYTARWHESPYVAATDLWISAADGFMHRVRREFLENRWRFPAATVEETFVYVH